LEYILQVRNWNQGMYDLALQVETGKKTFKGITAQLAKDRTSMIRISHGDALYFAFTPMTAVGFGRGLEQMGDDGLKLPEPIVSSDPMVLRELPEGEGVISFRFLGIVKTSGRMDFERYLFLECPHLALVNEPFRKMLKESRFKPGERKGQSVEALVALEFVFDVW
jgi:hypothetical protein